MKNRKRDIPRHGSLYVNNRIMKIQKMPQMERLKSAKIIRPQFSTLEPSTMSTEFKEIEQQEDY